MGSSWWRSGLACLLLPAACTGGDAPRIVDCESAGALEPFCGFENPEDLVVLPGGDWLLGSQMRSQAGASPKTESPIAKTGSLIAIPVARLEPRKLYPPAAGSQPPTRPADLGDPGCPGPPDPDQFAPHGLDLALRPVQAPLLLVVNHGGREAVEFFEIGWAEGAPALWWRGCAELPIPGWPNDVVALPDRGFVVTRMFDAVSGFAFLADGARMALGWPTGSVLEWTPQSGWRDIVDIPAVGPNGIEVSPDGSTLYVASWGSGEVYVRARVGDDVPEPIAVGPHPDNLTWSSDGRLLVASQIGGLSEISGCSAIEQGVCAIPFQVDSIDPETHQGSVLFEHDAASAMGFATVALEHEGNLYLGTAAGDRLARWTLPTAP
jgi:hypothetical protein